LLEERILTPELLELGSFDIKDMAYLGGGRLSTLYRLSSGGRLRPRYISGGHRTGMWSFAQLIAYRTWRYFSLRSGRRQFPAGLVPELESLARSVDVAHVAVAADGRLLERDQSERELNVQSPWHDRETGQEIFEEVLTIDQVFEPFSLGGGRVPHLVHPSRYTHVDPSILGGTPTVRTARIAARAIAEIERKQGRDAVREAYPELSLEELSDALRVGLELVGKS